jgi:hypothetical protein
MIDLDAERATRAARREGENPNGIPVRFAGEDYLLPAEVPASVIDPLFDGQIDITELVRVLVSTSSEQGGFDTALVALARRPDLPASVLVAVRATLQGLFGLAQWDRFWAAGPSFPDLIALIRNLAQSYGVSLGESSGSGGPSPSDGPTSSTISSSTTDSTPDGSGALVTIPI